MPVRRTAERRAQGTGGTRADAPGTFVYRVSPEISSPPTSRPPLALLERHSVCRQFCKLLYREKNTSSSCPERGAALAGQGWGRGPAQAVMPPKKDDLRAAGRQKLEAFRQKKAAAAASRSGKSRGEREGGESAGTDASTVMPDAQAEPEPEQPVSAPTLAPSPPGPEPEPASAGTTASSVGGRAAAAEDSSAPPMMPPPPMPTPQAAPPATMPPPPAAVKPPHSAPPPPAPSMPPPVTHAAPPLALAAKAVSRETVFQPLPESPTAEPPRAIPPRAPPPPPPPIPSPVTMSPPPPPVKPHTHAAPAPPAAMGAVAGETFRDAESDAATLELLAETRTEVETARGELYAARRTAAEA